MTAALILLTVLAVAGWVLAFRANAREKVTEATFTFVAIDDEGRPRPVPPELG